MPVTGKQARKAVVSALERFASQVQGTVTDLDSLLPKGLFSGRGTLLHTVCRTVHTISKHRYVRIVDKGVGELWAFCKNWLWRQTEQILRAAKYISEDATPEEIVAEAVKLIKEHGWNANPRARFCVLYIIGKAKSLKKQMWLWRPNAAYLESQIRKRNWRTYSGASLHMFPETLDQ